MMPPEPRHYTVRKLPNLHVHINTSPTVCRRFMQGHSFAQAQTWAVQGCQHRLQVAFKRQAGRPCPVAA